MKKRPKMSVKSKICGSISILLIVIMVPMMTLSAFVVDTSRLNLAKSSVSSAGDLAINSALANYDTVLKDVYGLFAMSQDETTEDLQKRLKDYGVAEEKLNKELTEAEKNAIKEYKSNLTRRRR